MNEPSRSFFAELKRRNVFRVGLAYVVTAWLVAQAADLALDAFAAPEWVMKATLLLLLLGFPLALIFAWAFEKTPEGLKLERNVDRSQSITSLTGKKMDRGIIVALAIAVVYFAVDKYVLDHDVSGTRATTSDVSEILDRSIAVLPFANMSSDAEQDYFANGIQEDILTYLARVADLRVISRTSVLKYAGKQDDVRAIAKELGVSHILEGSVRKSGNRVRVTAQLIDAVDDEHVWADNYDRDLTDVFAIQTEIANKIVAALQANLTPQEAELIEARPTSSVVAYDLYLRAREILNRAEWSMDKFQEAEPLTRAALAEDPDFALAHLQLADIFAVYYWRGERSPERRESVRLEIDEAMRIAPELPEAQLALGEYYYRVMSDFQRALDAYDKAAEKLPNSADVADRRGAALRRLGRWDESIAALELGRELEPTNKTIVNMLMETLDFSRRWEEALAVAETEIDKGDADPAFEAGWAGTRIRYLGDLDAARKVLARIPPSSWSSLGLRATLMFYERDFNGMQEFLQRPDVIKLLQEPGREGYQSSMNGFVCLLLGEEEQARRYYRHALQELEKGERTYSDEDPTRYAQKATVLAYLGEREAALTAIAHAMELAPESKDRMRGVSIRQQNAVVLAVLGETQQALDELEYQLEIPHGFTKWELYLDPQWDPLREEPRFQAMVADVAKVAAK